MNILSFGQQPQPQTPSQKNARQESLWQDRDALTRRINALTRERNLLDAKLYNLMRYEE